jgi:predicted DCC family thiol-disulfide oxidoreductase YuxK
LPTVAQRPNADVVIYDGHCGFCAAQVRRLNRWDRGGRLAYLSLHDPATAERYPDLCREQLMQQMVVVDRWGERHGGALAVRYLTRRLPALWFLAPILHIPLTLPLWQWLYRAVAKRRYGLAGSEKCESDACDA